MPQQTLASRVDSLERRVKSLEVLPGRMDRLESQFLQMRQEVRSEFSAVRAEIRAGDEGLRADIRAGDEETRRLMRVLHEDVIARLSLIQETKGNRSAKPKAHARSKKR